MRKILFHLNSMERGGAERVVANLSEQFVTHGYNVYIATERQGEDEYEINSQIERAHVGLTSKQEKDGRIIKYIDRVINLRKYIKKVRPDIVLAFARKANYRALSATIGMKIPVIISIRTNPEGYYDFPSDKIQIPILFRRAAGCVFQTPEQRDFFPVFMQKKSRIILNPINDRFIGRKIPDERKKTVVHSGRLDAFKNQPMLIRAFEIVHRKHPDYILKIFGPDSLDGTKKILENLIEKYHAQDYVKLMGSSNRLEEEMINCAAAAFSSNCEGMPNALLEAMALGLPVVSTDCPSGGPGMLITPEENGLLVPVNDDASMAAAINRLIEDREFAQRLGRNAAKIGEIANSDTIFEQWKDYVEEICR